MHGVSGDSRALAYKDTNHREEETGSSPTLCMLGNLHIDAVSTGSLAVQKDKAMMEAVSQEVEAGLETNISLIHGSLYEGQGAMHGMKAVTLHEVEVVEDSFPAGSATAAVGHHHTQWKRAEEQECREIVKGKWSSGGTASTLVSVLEDISSCAVLAVSWSHLRRLESTLDELILQ
ncbi:hypothetical protein ACOSQ4_027516 [Xanthoceras sorbifolium]